jgi:ornithine decarboxylase
LRRISELLKDTKPFFKVCTKPLINQVNLWKKYIPNIQPYYAVKCNNDDYLLNILAKNQINFDCASKGEIKQILDLGIDCNRIIYANPYKSNSSIEYSTDKNIPLTVIDSVEELEKIKNKNIETLIRVKVNDKESLMPFSSKFGSSFEETISILKLAKSYNKNISGFSFHVGSGCYNPYQYFDAVKMIYDIINKTKYLNHNYKIIDIGGGYSGLCEDEFIKQASSINNSLKLFENNINFLNGIKFISEPGRFYVTKTYTLYVPIIAKRKTNNKIFYIIDESIYSSFSNITYDMYKPKFELMKDFENKDSKSKNEKKTLFDSVIFGRTCDSADRILETELPELNIGDYFEVKNMGAYTTVSSTNFNGFETTEKIYLC